MFCLELVLLRVKSIKTSNKILVHIRYFSLREAVICIVVVVDL